MSQVSAVTNKVLSSEDDRQQGAKANKELSSDDFIKLFLAQLKHQNPMNPTDSSAILQQMSQISAVSASKSMQNTMEALERRVEMAMANNQIFQASGLIGHEVELQSSVGILNKNNQLQGSVFVSDPATDVVVTIKDTAGQAVRTVHVGPTAGGGLVDFVWDGKDDNGNACTAASYRVSAVARVNGADQAVNTALGYTVKSIAMDSNGNTILNTEGMGGVLIKDVIKVL